MKPVYASSPVYNNRPVTTHKLLPALAYKQILTPALCIDMLDIFSQVESGALMPTSAAAKFAESVYLYLFQCCTSSLSRPSRLSCWTASLLHIDEVTIIRYARTFCTRRHSLFLLQRRRTVVPVAASTIAISIMARGPSSCARSYIPTNGNPLYISL